MADTRERMTRDRAVTIAAVITDHLLVNGAGDRADRLVLTVDGPPTRDLGGWSRQPLIDRIARLLQQETNGH